MTHSEDPASKDYPHGRGYGHDYMRGGEVFGGYGYSEREEYDTPLGALHPQSEETAPEEPTEGPQP